MLQVFTITILICWKRKLITETAMNRNSVGLKVKMMCDKACLSQKCFAEYLGIDQKQIIKFEKGELRLSINQLEKICDLFSCSCNDLMEGITDELQQDYYFDFSTISSDDLTGISRINKIVRNSKEMNNLLTGRLVQR